MIRLRHGLALVLVLVVAPLLTGADDKKPAEEKMPGPGGLNVIVRMQGPYDAEEPLQIVCYFKKKDGQKLQGAPVELDKRLGGVIASLRDRGEFAGDELETLLIDTKKKIPAKKLLLIGLGDDANLSLELMERVGRVAYREAARLGVNRVAFAPLIRDQGIDKIPTGDVARYVVRGMLLARDTDVRLQKEGLAEAYTLNEWVSEAGPAFYQETIDSVKKALEEASAAVKDRKQDPFITSGK